MAMRNFYNEIKSMKVKELPNHLKPMFTIDYVKKSIQRGLDNYHAKYIMTDSVDPLYHICFGGMIFSYLVALPEERRHLEHQQHAKEHGAIGIGICLRFSLDLILVDYHGHECSTGGKNLGENEDAIKTGLGGDGNMVVCCGLDGSGITGHQQLFTKFWEAMVAVPIRMATRISITLVVSLFLSLISLLKDILECNAEQLLAVEINLEKEISCSSNTVI
ncbi:hypothetical protein RJ641_020316 [Dillenia turbinata]|uniref:Uncharacterized protein n=1 Tax=Dillenia turbinata TaxID=194707 RepID=A0AAN8ULV9_9MAGN